jgi:hypothetical protein
MDDLTAIPDPRFEYLRVETLHCMDNGRRMLGANSDVAMVQPAYVAARGDMAVDTRELDKQQAAHGHRLRRRQGKWKV